MNTVRCEEPTQIQGQISGVQVGRLVMECKQEERIYVALIGFCRSYTCEHDPSLEFTCMVQLYFMLEPWRVLCTSKHEKPFFLASTKP